MRLLFGLPGGLKRSVLCRLDRSLVARDMNTFFSTSRRVLYCTAVTPESIGTNE